jgi:hypothetical protein
MRLHQGPCRTEHQGPCRTEHQGPRRNKRVRISISVITALLSGEKTDYLIACSVLNMGLTQTGTHGSVVWWKRSWNVGSI